MRTKNSISIKSDDELKILREGGIILSSIIKELKGSLTPNITTHEVDQIAENLISNRNVKPAFKGYRGFPGCVCASVNEEVVHGIPSGRMLLEGDILSIDIGIIHKEFYMDSAITVGIGKIKPEFERLLAITQESLYKGIDQACVNNQVSDISHAIQTLVEAHEYSIVRDFVGHGIGRNLHEDPEIPNFGPPHTGPVLKEGMVLAIEPMVNLGTWKTKILKDGWTVATEDGKFSAHFEHTIAITKNGPEILTKQ